MAAVEAKVKPLKEEGKAWKRPLTGVLVEAKAVEKVLPIHKPQLLSYMKLLDVPLGLLINFHEMKVTDGISRLILPGANL